MQTRTLLPLASCILLSEFDYNQTVMYYFIAYSVVKYSIFVLYVHV